MLGIKFIKYELYAFFVTEKKKTIKQKRIFNSAYLERYLDLPISVASPRPKRDI